MRELVPIARMLHVEVVYALRERQVLLTLEVEEGTTARQAIARSSILQRYPEIGLVQCDLGVFGRVVSPDTPLQDGDRVEIYRRLIADPMQVRHARARRAPPAERRR